MNRQVDYSNYKENVLILKKGANTKDEPYNYGIELVNMTLKDEKMKLISKKHKKQ